MDIEEDDEIAQEIDIIYSGQFSNETKIFQFPLIPNNLMNIDNIKTLRLDNCFSRSSRCLANLSFYFLLRHYREFRLLSFLSKELLGYLNSLTFASLLCNNANATQ